MLSGSCLCGAITVKVEGTLPKATACHCTMCRKWSGHYGVSVEVSRDSLSLEGEKSLVWYMSSDKARRGFCSSCGTNLFFDPLDREKHKWIGVLMGAFDGATHTRLGLHIFAAEKGDYYDITDDVPRNEY